MNVASADGHELSTVNGRARVGMRRISWMVLALVVATSIVAFNISNQVVADSERRLIEQRATQMGALFETFADTFTGEVSVVAALAGAEPERFDEIVQGQFADGDDQGIEGGWSLIRVGEGIEIVDQTGELSRFDFTRPDVVPLLVEAAATGETRVLGLQGEGIDRTLAMAAGRRGSSGDTVAVIEFSLLAEAAGSGAGQDDSSSSFNDLSMGLYLGTDPLAEAEIFSFGLDETRGPHAFDLLEIGPQEVLLEVGSRTSLIGSPADQLPEILLGLGVFLGVAVTAVVELNARRKDDALRTVGELEEKNAALDRAIAEQQAAEDARQKAETELRQAQRLEAVGQLAGGIAHDFNNLLAAIVSFADLAAEDLGGHPAREDLDEIRAAARRGSSLTGQLLRFSRSEPDADDDLLDPNVVVGEIHRLLERTIGEDVNLTLDLAGDVPTVVADAGELEHVITNLVVNARDAIEAHGAVVIRTRRRDVVEPADGLSVGAYAEIVVSDDGAGMDPDIAARAFEPFFTTKERGRGTGLGLATVYGSVQRCKGHVRIDSSPGRGTSVIVTIPALDVSAPSPADEPTDAPTGRGETVLLVEDESAVRRAVRRMLERRGYDVIECPDGLSALTHHLPGAFDVLVTDVVMPNGVSGVDVADHFRTSVPHLPVVFLSGYSDDLLIDRGIGDEAVVTKPFTETELLAALRAALDGAGSRS